MKSGARVQVLHSVLQFVFKYKSLALQKKVVRAGTGESSGNTDADSEGNKSVKLRPSVV